MYNIANKKACLQPGKETQLGRQQMNSNDKVHNKLQPHGHPACPSRPRQMR